MAKYIPTDKLIAEIERLAETLPEVRSTMEGLLSLIDSLQQEQPEEELKLEEEIKDKYSRDTSTLKTRSQYAKLARHFYELGRNAGKNEKVLLFVLQVL